jgi:sugar phosphate isomerase/epimerase
MKFGCFNVVVPDRDAAATVALLAQLGYDGIEWRLRLTKPGTAGQPPSFWGNFIDPIGPRDLTRRAPELKKLCADAGIASFSVAGYLQMGERDELAAACEGCAALGARALRLWSPPYERGKAQNAREVWRRAADDLPWAVAVAAPFGVRLLFETHQGTITPGVSACLRLLDGQPPERVGVIFDPGNMLNEGRENWRLGLELLGPYLSHVHYKNNRAEIRERRPDGTAVWDLSACPPADGLVDWREVLGDLRAVGYDGWISNENFEPGIDPESKLRRDLAYIKKLASELPG